MHPTFPRMIRVRQKYPATAPVDIPTVLAHEFSISGIASGLKQGARIAVAVGSRGITNLQAIVRAVTRILKEKGTHPFIVPAMGSHGGATAEGQAELLKEYGITETQVQVPLHAAMEVQCLGHTPEGIPVYCSAEALRADGIVVINRIKPHTDFSGQIGSGVLKMLVIGLGKRTGAATFHLSTSRVGYEQAIRSIARVVLKNAPILGGVAIVENQFHETAHLALLKPDEMESREEALFIEAARLMPRLPFAEIDLLIVDRIGKNISGAGMDPNIIGRGVHGYSSYLGDKAKASITIRRIMARDLTPETHGNAIGIGFADFTTARLVAAMDKQTSYINALTSLTPNSVKIPIHFETDREVISHALGSLALSDPRQTKVLRIADTLSLEHLEASEACLDTVQSDEDLEALDSPQDLDFDEFGNLRPMQLPKSFR